MNPVFVFQDYNFPHSIMQPPLCFTMDVFCSHWCAVFVFSHKLSFACVITLFWSHLTLTPLVANSQQCLYSCRLFHEGLSCLSLIYLISFRFTDTPFFYVLFYETNNPEKAQSGCSGTQSRIVQEVRMILPSAEMMTASVHVVVICNLSYFLKCFL